MTPCSDPLDDEVVWHKLIADYVNHPMNYGTDIHAVGTIALAAGIDPSRAIARVLAYYHHDACNESCKTQG
jgi:hypothetical protein